MSKTYSKTRILVECALMIAIGTVLSNIKIFTMPNGGSVTLLSMLPFVLVSFRHGVKWGLFTGLVNGCLQMLLVLSLRSSYDCLHNLFHDNLDTYHGCASLPL